MYKILVASTIALYSTLSAANAADIVYNSPENPGYNEASIWGGGYLGASIGYNWSNIKLSDYDVSDNGRSRGFMGGLYAGYNWEFSNAYLFGLEGDINYSNLSNSSFYSRNNQVYEWDRRVEWEGALRARIGFNYERVLPFIAGGVAFAGTKNGLNERNVEIANASKTLVGYTIGAGFDYAVTNSLLFRAEYRFSDYGKKTFFNDNVDAKLTSNNVRLGLAYKF